MEPMPRGEKHRVAVLGGGPAGLAAAYGLTQTRALRERYEVTVYQVGWRVGGKVTSGRQGVEKRVLQNGTHYLFGCYENSFRVARRAYEDLDRAGISSFGSFDDAFLPLSTLALKQYFRGAWHDWVISIPTNSKVPGRGEDDPLGALDYLSMGIQLLIDSLAGWEVARACRPTPPFAPGSEPPDWWDRIVGPIERGLADVVNDSVAGLLRLALGVLQRSGAEPEALAAVSWMLTEARRILWQRLGPQVESDLESCRSWMLVDLGCTSLIGMIADDVMAPGGMAAIDGVDFREWLHRHGASEITLGSPLVTGWYHAIASFIDGDGERPSVSAGVTLNALMSAATQYRGAFAFQARRELGDTVIAPLYEALRRRGVKFRFFHRGWELEPRDGKIERIRVEQQVQLCGGDPDAYQPFTTVRGQPAWREHPDPEQIVDPERLEGYDLEDFYTEWPHGEDHWLERGKHFDTAVLAIPIGALGVYCEQLVEEQPSWRRMVDNVRSVDTSSLWLYFRPKLPDLGWPYPSPVLTGYQAPLSTWEDTSYLVDAEDWPHGEQPGTISSLFGPLQGPPDAPGPDAPGGYPERQLAAAEAIAWKFATEYAGGLWPDATSPENPQCVDWELLVDLENRHGPERFAFQKVRANYGPIQRYTLALPGTLQHRLRADESSYANLFLAGDWTRNTGDVGCVEAAIASGLYAAIAICGEGSVAGSGKHNGL
jgi:uncharacterized protein with NAD-binding domain and iron-sulfur cluster